jgi:hypothetical protein
MAKKKQRSSERAKTNGGARARVKIATEDLPRRTLEAAIPIAKIVRDPYAGKATWQEITEALKISPKNPRNMYPLWAATAYGLIKKEENGQYSLTETGRKILAPNYEGEDREGVLKAILTPSILSRFYTDYKDSPIPADELLDNVLENRYAVPRDRTKEAAATILENARFAKILKEEDGRRTLQFDLSTTPTDKGGEPGATVDVQQLTATIPSALSNACFVITPLGEEGTIERKHADAIFSHLIEPVLKEFNIHAIRADKISKPGVITKQVVEHLAWSKLCIADLSFNNPNAFYEMGVRHTFLLPMIQIIRKGDKIPFDVSQGRTIVIDTGDPYTIMDRFVSARRELKEHVESCLGGNEKPEDNPILMFLPGLKVTIPKISL